MSELIKELIKIVRDGDIAIDNLIDLESESDSIFKKFPFMSIDEKREAIQRYGHLRDTKSTWMEQIALVKDFLLNTVSDLESLEDGWFEKRVEKRRFKKLYGMLSTSFTTSDSQNEENTQSDNDVETDSKNTLTSEQKEILKKDIEEIQEKKLKEMKK